jgi:tetratricopeptide (TPR) repeat protein
MRPVSAHSIKKIIGLLMAGGLLLRLGGIRWGINVDYGFHPDEWPFNLIYQISQGDFSELGLSVWYNVYHFISAFVYLVIRKIVFWAGALFNVYRMEEEVTLNLILMGRITSAFLGTLTIYLVYKTGQVLFNNSTIGMLAAAICTVVPINVVQTHYLETDVPLAFMATLSFLFSFLILQHPNKKTFYWGGLIFGLTFSTKPSGLLMAIPFLVSFVYLLTENLSWDQGKNLLKKVLLFSGSTLLGILLGAPGLTLKFSYLAPRMFSFLFDLAEITPVPQEGPWWEGPQAFRFGWAIHYLREGFTSPLVILAVLGILYFLYLRKKEGILLLSFPVGYFFIVAFFGRRFGERDVVIMIPFLCLLAAAFLYLFFERLGKAPLWKGAFILLSLFLWINPLWTSLQVVYYYWQDDNRQLAHRWMTQNIPAGSPVAIDGYGPKSIDFPLLALEYDRPAKFYQDNAQYLVTSSIDGDRFFSIFTHRPVEPEGRIFLDLQKRFRLIKEFDLNFKNQDAKKNGAYNFPDFLNPLIRVYSTQAAEIRDKVYFPRLQADARENYGLSFVGLNEYEKETTSFLILPRGVAKRILRSSEPLSQILLILSTTQPLKKPLTLSNGWRDQQIKLNPGESKTVLIRPSCSFPYIRNLYGIKLQGDEEAAVWGQTVTEPFRIGVQLVNHQKYQEAIPFLQEAVKRDPARLEGYAFLGLAYHQAGESASARRAFQEIETRDPDYWPRMLQLSRGNLPYPEWLNQFAASTRYHLPLLQQALTYRHRIPPGTRLSSTIPLEMKEKNFTAAAAQEADGNRSIKLWSNELFPQGFFLAKFSVKINPNTRGDLPVVRLDVLKHAHTGLVSVGERLVLGKEAGAQTESVSEFLIPFTNPVFGGDFEFRIFGLDKKTRFDLQEVEVSLDLRETLRNNLKQLLTAREKAWALK